MTTIELEELLVYHGLIELLPLIDNLDSDGHRLELDGILRARVAKFEELGTRALTVITQLDELTRHAQHAISTNQKVSAAVAEKLGVTLPEQPS